MQKNRFFCPCLVVQVSGLRCALFHSGGVLPIGIPSLFSLAARSRAKYTKKRASSQSNPGLHGNQDRRRRPASHAATRSTLVSVLNAKTYVPKRKQTLVDFLSPGWQGGRTKRFPTAVAVATPKHQRIPASGGGTRGIPSQTNSSSSRRGRHPRLNLRRLNPREHGCRLVQGGPGLQREPTRAGLEGRE